MGVLRPVCGAGSGGYFAVFSAARCGRDGDTPGAERYCSSHGCAAALGAAQFRAREFGNSPTLTQPFTLRLEEQALQVWSKFEQYTLPWQGITYAKETKDYIILIGCYRMGLFVIEKADCDPADLNALLSALHEKAPAFGGAK